MNLQALAGPNFSGRTAKLRAWAGLPANANAPATPNGGAYVGLDPIGNLSGLAPTVRAEFELLAADGPAADDALHAMEALGFGRCIDRNPFTLSGGEQMVTAVLAALAGRPQRLAVDCAFEQLSPATRTGLIEHLRARSCALLLADNRLSEWFSGDAEPCHGSAGAPVLEPEAFARRSDGPVVELVDLSFYYVKGSPVLQGLNVLLEPGRLHLLKGPNGAGKSTLCKILAGLLKPTGGEIRVDGKPIQPWRKPGALARYHFQDPDLQLFATRVSAQLDNHDEALPRALGLAGFLDAHPLDLPYVLRKRLAIGCAIGGAAPVVALDEPTLAQDNAAAAAIRRMASGLAGLVISHSNIFHGSPEIRLGGTV